MVDLSRKKQETIDLVGKRPQFVNLASNAQFDRSKVTKEVLSREEAFRRQVEIVEEINKPAWQVHKD